jgi:hypothetical protein
MGKENRHSPLKTLPAKAHPKVKGYGGELMWLAYDGFSGPRHVKTMNRRFVATGYFLPPKLMCETSLPAHYSRKSRRNSSVAGGLI